MKNLNQIRPRNLSLDTITSNKATLDARNTQLNLANLSLLYTNLTSTPNTLLALRTNANTNGWQINSLGTNQDQFLLTDSTSGLNTGLSVRTGSNPKVGIGNSSPNCALQVTGGVVVNNSTADAIDPGAGNVSISGSLSSGNLTASGNASINQSGASSSNQLTITANSGGASASATASTFIQIGMLINGGFGGEGGQASIRAFHQSTTSAQGTGLAFFTRAPSFGAVTERLTINGNGNVGIATNTAGARLQVNGGLAITTTATAATDPGAGNLSVAGNAVINGNGTVIGGTFNLTNATSNMLSFANTPGSVPAFTTRSTGTKLLLRQTLSDTTTDYAIGVDSTGVQWYGIPSATVNHAHAFFGATTELVRFQGDGRNGIGTNTPGCRLQVNGGVAISNLGTAVTDPGAGNLAVTGESRLNGGLVLSTRIATLGTGGTIVLQTSDCVIILDVTGNGTIQLPTSPNGKVFRIKKADNSTNTLTIRPVDNTKLIDGAATATFTTGRPAIDVISDVNNNWWIF